MSPFRVLQYRPKLLHPSIFSAVQAYDPPTHYINISATFPPLSASTYSSNHILKPTTSPILFTIVCVTSLVNCEGMWGIEVSFKFEHQCSVL